MPRWSTTGVAQVVKLVIVPLFGLVMFYLEQQRDVPRGLIIGASLVLIGVLPASFLEYVLAHRSPPAPPAPPTQPTGLTGPTAPPLPPPADGSQT